MTVYENQYRQEHKRGHHHQRTVAAMFWASLWLFLVVSCYIVVSTMDYNDQVKVEEFRREYKIVTDDQGEPQLVEVRNAQAMRQVQTTRTMPRD